jgi:hypothetical protein
MRRHLVSIPKCNIPMFHMAFHRQRGDTILTRILTTRRTPSQPLIAARSLPQRLRLKAIIDRDLKPRARILARSTLPPEPKELPLHQLRHRPSQKRRHHLENAVPSRPQERCRSSLRRCLSVAVVAQDTSGIWLAPTRIGVNIW